MKKILGNAATIIILALCGISAPGAWAQSAQPVQDDEVTVNCNNSLSMTV